MFGLNSRWYAQRREWLLLVKIIREGLMKDPTFELHFEKLVGFVACKNSPWFILRPFCLPGLPTTPYLNPTPLFNFSNL